MKVRITPILCALLCLCMIFPFPIQAKQDVLQEQMIAYLTNNQIDTSKVSIKIKELDTHFSIAINEQADFVAASVYKLPLAMLWYEKVNNHKAQLEDAFVYQSNMDEDSEGFIDTNYAVGSPICLEDLLHTMILYSDNTSAHILFENLGGWNAFKQAAAKYSSTKQDEAYYSNDNILNANYMSDCIQYLYNHKDRFATLLNDLQQAEPNRFLNLKVNCQAYQKYGEYDMALNVAGFVDCKHPYSIVVFTSLGDQGEQVIGDLNQICYNYFNKK